MVTLITVLAIFTLVLVFILIYQPFKARLIVTIILNNIKIQGKMTIQLTDTQFVQGQVSGTDAKGYPAPFETGSYVYSSSDETVATITQDPSDETMFTITSVGPGTAQIQFSADADLGAGVTTLSGTVDVTVVAGMAVTMSASLGTPQG